MGAGVMNPRRLRAELARHLAGGLALLVLLFTIGWVLAHALGNGLSASSNTPQFVVVMLNGLTLAGLYFIVASGFTLIFGLMRVVNMAHGSLYLLGGYVAYEILQHEAINYWAALVLASLAIGIFGLLMQQVFLRWNQGQELRQALITIALSIIIGDQLLSYFGGQAVTITPPPRLAGSVSLGVYGIQYPSFRLVVLGFAILIGVALWYGIQHTRFGIIIRAGVDDRAMTSALGVNIQAVFAVTFFIGALLAGLGGVLGGTMIALAPGQDAAFLLSSLVVVIVGGLGSLGGAVVGALALGLVDQLSIVYLPAGYTNYSILLTFALLLFVLAVRPTGLFGRG
jgi:branched-chain amino acid transport system permease protein